VAKVHFMHCLGAVRHELADSPGSGVRDVVPEELQDLNGYVAAVKVRQQLRQGCVIKAASRKIQACS